MTIYLLHILTFILFRLLSFFVLIFGLLSLALIFALTFTFLFALFDLQSLIFPLKLTLFLFLQFPIVILFF